MLCRNFRSVLKPECHCAILSYRGVADDRQPQRFVKLINHKRSGRNVLNEDFDEFCFAEPFPFGGFQFIYTF